MGRHRSVPRRAGGKDIRYILINDRATLLWCANLASLELHTFLHRANALDTPGAIVFDLDPGEGSGIATCAQVALLLRERLEKLGLKAWPKVSGSKGIQLYVPLNRKATYADTQPFAHSLADALSREHPALIVSDMAKSLRRNKVLIDWSQNSDFKTTIGVYSLRAKERPYLLAPRHLGRTQRAPGSPLLRARRRAGATRKTRRSLRPGPGTETDASRTEVT